MTPNIYSNYTLLSKNFLNPMLQDLQNNVSPKVLSIIRNNVSNPIYRTVEVNVSHLLKLNLANTFPSFLSSYR